ncbi:hypothetical protein QTO34_014847 [Cnephaeus nilssonii]|uniref:Uncharacterized protein n=1 Tax=Cnephaeus nilssonii TaxID=3371016 RepID=A0AA40LUF6_CNENI|nr:hypothetical protein QTO34_014847 [Eptesicus nilssonii]
MTWPGPAPEDSAVFTTPPGCAVSNERTGQVGCAPKTPDMVRRCDLLMGAASGEHLLVLLNRYACGVAAAVAQLAGALVVQQGPLLTCRDHPCIAPTELPVGVFANEHPVTSLSVYPFVHLSSCPPTHLSSLPTCHSSVISAYLLITVHLPPPPPPSSSP